MSKPYIRDDVCIVLGLAALLLGVGGIAVPIYLHQKSHAPSISKSTIWLPALRDGTNSIDLGLNQDGSVNWRRLP